MYRAGQIGNASEWAGEGFDVVRREEDFAPEAEAKKSTGKAR